MTYPSSGKNAVLPEAADGGGSTPKPNPPSPILRWVWRLDCGHAVLADDECPDEKRSCYCPGCGMSFPIERAFEYRDEDVSV